MKKILIIPSGKKLIPTSSHKKKCLKNNKNLVKTLTVSHVKTKEFSSKNFFLTRFLTWNKHNFKTKDKTFTCQNFYSASDLGKKNFTELFWCSLGLK